MHASIQLLTSAELPEREGRDLIYVMDPMCSWCYAFATELEAFLSRHGELRVWIVLGGLAPDSDQPMDSGMAQRIEATWTRIEEMTGAAFNHDFWREQQPRRSTWPACRAVIAAGRWRDELTYPMIRTIQSAYYSEARNPSNIPILTACAIEAGMDVEPFTTLLTDPQTEALLQIHLHWCQLWQVNGFPALFQLSPKGLVPLTHGYCRSEELEKRWLSANPAPPIH